MVIRPNRYSDPALGAAFENIASLFAPMGGGDVAAYASAEHDRQRAAEIAQRLELVDLFANGEGINDHIGIAAGLYNPAQSWGAVTLADSTTQRGQDLTHSADIYATDRAYDANTYGADRAYDADIYGSDRNFEASTANNIRDNASRVETALIEDGWRRYETDRDYAAAIETNAATNRTTIETELIRDAANRYAADVTSATAIATNAADNARALQINAMSNLLAPVDTGEVTRAVDADMWAAVGLPEMPATAEFAGPEAVLSRDQVLGQWLQDMGVEDPALMEYIAAGENNPIEAVDENGNAILVAPHRAEGMGVYEAPGSTDPRLTNVILPDGSVTTARETANGLIDAQTGAPLPPGTTMYSTSAQGSNADIGLGTATANNIDQRLIDLQMTQVTTERLRDVLRNSPASQGLVGDFRSFVQNLGQVAGEVGAYAGGDLERLANETIAEAAEMGIAEGNFDPSLPAVQMLGNILAFQYAKMMTGERLSNEMLRSARAALGLDNLTANNADTLARLDHVLGMIESQRVILEDARASNTAVGRTTAATPPVGGEAALEDLLNQYAPVP